MMPTSTHSRPVLLADEPVTSVDAYLACGGGEGLLAAQRMSPEEVIAEVRHAGLQGRGGAGFPAGVKWATVASHPCPTRYVVCNAAEGEPGTFKDRWLLRSNPYLVLEGVAIAAYAVGAREAFVAVKARFAEERAALERARRELADAGLLGNLPVEIVAGPDDYLFGEEKALLEVIEGNHALPRLLPPYQVGLFAGSGSPNPTVMNNAETLAHTPHILRHGAEAFRSVGADGAPGTMLFTVCGDVTRPGVYELPLGTPLRALVVDAGGGAPDGRAIKAVVPGVSAGVLTGAQLDLPLTFEALRATGSGLGSGGFVVYDESACMVGALATLSGFLGRESCGQCPACSQGCIQIADAARRLEAGEAGTKDMDLIRSRVRSVTGGHRCGLPVGAQALVDSFLSAFPDEFTAHLDGPCPLPRPLPRPLPSPFLADFDPVRGVFIASDEAADAVPAPLAGATSERA